MALVDAHDFVKHAPNGRMSKELRLGTNGNVKCFLLNARYIESNGGVELVGTVILASSGKVVARQKTSFYVVDNKFLGTKTGSFGAMSSGYMTPKMHFSIKEKQYGFQDGGSFVHKKLFSLEDVKEMHNPFSEEPNGFMGRHIDVPKSVQVLFRGIGCTVDVPTGDLVDSLINRYINK